MRIRLLVLLGILIASPAAPRAERLPLRAFTTADGLPHSRVNAIVNDSHGFLWFCTSNGLSRFDGSAFVNYGPDQGLPHSSTQDLVEDPRGVYWVATWGGGVFRLNPSAAGSGPIFERRTVGETLSSNRVHALALDRQGRLWAGTLSGLYVMDLEGTAPGFRQVDLAPAPPELNDTRITTLLVDKEGGLWIGGVDLLMHRRVDGALSLHSAVPPGVPGNVRSLLEDRDGRIWIGSEGGLTILGPGVRERRVRWRTIPPGPGGGETTVPLPNSPHEGLFLGAGHVTRESKVLALLRTSDGRVWASGGSGVLMEFRGSKLMTHTPADGVPEEPAAMAEDREGNLWIGSNVTGAARLAHGGFSAWDRADGLLYSGHGIPLLEPDGALDVVGAGYVCRFDGRRFLPVEVPVPYGSPGVWPFGVPALVDRAQAWWFGAEGRLVRFDKVSRIQELSRARPSKIWSERDGLPPGEITSLFEDSRRDVWIGMEGAEPAARLDRASGKIHRLPAEEGPAGPARAFGFAEDRAGNVWVAFTGHVGRWRGGRFETLGPESGLPAANTSGFHLDGTGRLWISRGGGGLCRLDDPDAADPRCVVYTTAEGLASDHVGCITEDRLKRIYVGLISGIDRLDPATGEVRHFSTSDGLSNQEIDWCLADRDGNLWFTARKGVSRLIPQSDPPPGPPPPVRITAVKLAGRPQLLSEMGELSLEGFVLPARRNQVEIEFGAISFSLRGPTRYQYLLEGAGGDWSTPATQRSVNLASLSPGSYRFLVRAVDSGGTASESPASVGFSVSPPLWQRWWFMTLVAAALAGTVYGMHRARVARLVELERVRTRLATDLHDDVGSSLSQIAILGEIVTRRAGEDGSIGEPATRIAALSREIIDSMNDIVWAINPARDHLADLTRRMRRFANDLLTARDIRLRFDVSTLGDDLPLGAEVRRNVYLVFKEGLNNAVRHSGCSEVGISFGPDKDRLVLKVSDNGIGFEEGDTSGGHGLSSMAARAAALCGSLRVESARGAGTTLHLAVPLGRGRRRRSLPVQVGIPRRGPPYDGTP